MAPMTPGVVSDVALIFYQAIKVYIFCQTLCDILFTRHPPVFRQGVLLCVLFHHSPSGLILNSAHSTTNVCLQFFAVIGRQP